MKKHSLLPLFRTPRWWNNPLLWSSGSAGVSLCAASVLARVPDFVSPSAIHVVVLVTLLLAMICAPFLAAVLAVATYPLNERYLWRLVQAYIAVMLLFANAYFLMVLLANSSAQAFQGIASPRVWRVPASDGRFIDTRRLFEVAVDCVHFSCVTITTLGYGDIHPRTWYSELLVDAEVLAGVGIVVVGIGRQFSKAPPHE